MTFIIKLRSFKCFFVSLFFWSRAFSLSDLSSLILRFFSISKKSSFCCPPLWAPVAWRKCLLFCHFQLFHTDLSPFWLFLFYTRVLFLFCWRPWWSSCNPHSVFKISTSHFSHTLTLLFLSFLVLLHCFDWLQLFLTSWVFVKRTPRQEVRCTRNTRSKAATHFHLCVTWSLVKKEAKALPVDVSAWKLAACVVTTGDTLVSGRWSVCRKMQKQEPGFWFWIRINSCTGSVCALRIRFFTRSRWLESQCACVSVVIVSIPGEGQTLYPEVCVARGVVTERCRFCSPVALTDGIGSVTWSWVARCCRPSGPDHSPSSPVCPAEEKNILISTSANFHSFSLCFLGLIHTGRARVTPANGTCCCQWECSHCSQAKSKEKRSNLRAHPVWIGP